MVLVENETAQRARSKINSALRNVQASLALIGEPAILHYSPPPLFGGIAGPVHLVENLFMLHQLRIDPKLAFDVLDRAIGQYEALKPNLFRQLFNPLCWAELVLGKVLGVPFRILAAAGFNADRIEHSLFGKFVKATAGFVMFFAAFLAMLHYLGWLIWFRGLVSQVLGRLAQSP